MLHESQINYKNFSFILHCSDVLNIEEILCIVLQFVLQT